MPCHAHAIACHVPIFTCLLFIFSCVCTQVSTKLKMKFGVTVKDVTSNATIKILVSDKASQDLLSMTPEQASVMAANATAAQRALSHLPGQLIMFSVLKKFNANKNTEEYVMLHAKLAPQDAVTPTRIAGRPNAFAEFMPPRVAKRGRAQDIPSFD